MPMVDSEEEVVIPGVGGWPAASIPRKEMCRIIQPRMSEIFGMVRDQLEKKSLAGHLGGGIVLTGGGSLLPGAVELAQEMFDVPARVGFPAKLGGLTKEYQNPIYSTGVGLVMYGTELSQVRRTGQNTGKRAADGFIGKLKDWMKEFF